MISHLEFNTVKHVQINTKRGGSLVASSPNLDGSYVASSPNEVAAELLVQRYSLFHTDTT